MLGFGFFLRKVDYREVGPVFLIIHAFPVTTGAGHQAACALVTRNEEQPIKVSKLHPAPAVSHAGQ